MKGLLLLSGGFDSGVAGKIMLDQKMDVDAIHFSLEPFTDDSPEKKSINLCKKLGIKKLYVVKHAKEHQEIVKKCNHKLYFVISRRLMYKTAEKVAKENKYDALIDGTNIGQVSSQTLTNLSLVRKSVKTLVISPLLCYDKQEIIDKAKEIETYEISKGPEMCNVLGPKNPSTRANENILINEESKLTLKIENIFEEDRCKCILL